MENTIVAISTAPGNAGIGIVRMSGKESFSIIKKIFQPAHEKKIEGYTMQYGKIVNEQKEYIDEVLISFFVGPKSYTGEDVCEINSHGNYVILNQILKECMKQGAVLAEPGEFTKRAFLNGRIDLLQAEAVMEMIHSKSELERKAAMNGLEGFLSNEIKQIKKDILYILTNIEASIDYPEYDIEEKTNKQMLLDATEIVKKFLKLEDSFERGKILKDGVNVAIIGKPNAGKSSLLNTILKEERAIVTDIEGTTRDTIEEFITIKGIPFKIIDTAGIRDANNEIEKIGIEKSKKAIKDADLVLAVFDSSKKLTEEDIKILKAVQNKKTIILLNKIDLQDKEIKREDIEPYHSCIIDISIKNGEGLDTLYNKMVEMFAVTGLETENTSIITNIRHKQAIQIARENIEKAIDVIQQKIPIDITAIYFKQAVGALDEITGESVTEDIINDIFSKFCLGK